MVLLGVIVVAGSVAVLHSSLVPVRVKSIGSIARGELRIEVPDNLWQPEVHTIFPITEDVAGFVTLELRNPRFIRDEDPQWLRLALELEARVVQGGNERFPGQAVLRTQLKYDPAQRAVLLNNAQLVEFTFTGEAGRMVAALQQALSDAVAEELKDFVVVEIPEGEGYWQKMGLSRLREITIEDRKVVAVLGN